VCPASLVLSAGTMAAALDERILEQLYTWIDSIPLTRPKKDLKRDFSDGGNYLFNYLFDAGREVSTKLSVRSHVHTCPIN